MKAAIVVCFLALAAVALARPNDDHYTDRWDNINIDELLEKPTIVKAYMECCLNRGKCTPDAKELRSHIKEALENKCAKCTKAQQEGTKKVMKHLIEHEPAYWEELKAMYDPTGKYTSLYEEELKEIKKN